MPRSMMQVSPDQGALMQVLVAAVGAKNALEVGTFTGYSAICIARGLAEGGTLTCLELDDEYADIAQRNIEAAGVEDRVDIVRGPAGASLDAMPEEPMFDFVFLDADKTGYPDYYEQILPRMRPNALLLIDNILMGGDVVDPEPGTSTRSSRSSTRRSRRTTAWTPRSRWSRTGSRSSASAEWRVVQPQAEQLAARARGASAEAPAAEDQAAV